MSRDKQRPKAEEASQPAGQGDGPAPEALPPPPVAEVHLAEPGSLSEDDQRIAFVWKAHEYTGELIRFADAKASVILALTTGLLTILFGAKIQRHFLKISLNLTQQDTRDILLAAGSLGSLVSLAVAIGFAISVVVPRAGKAGRNSLLFWQGILQYQNPQDYVAELFLQNPAQLTMHLAEHLFILARICRTKYLRVRWSIWLAALGGALGGLVVMFTS
ncbi:MAG: hypothetical protein JO112_13715 [Planctomycetes bacterium]|nr:hypothetical protein [Planctomycetota bacterium]